MTDRAEGKRSVASFRAMAREHIYARARSDEDKAMLLTMIAAVEVWHLFDRLGIPEPRL